MPLLIPFILLFIRRTSLRLTLKGRPQRCPSWRELTVIHWKLGEWVLQGRQISKVGRRRVVRVGNDNTVMYYIKEAVWLSGQCIGLAMWWSLVQVFLSGYLWFVLGHPHLKSSATLVKSRLVASCQLGYFILLYCIWIINLFLSFWAECLQTSWIS